MDLNEATFTADPRRATPESGGRGESLPKQALLLIAADLEERRLLYAELLEAGYEVLPLPGLVYAVRAILMRRVTPSLVLLDIHGDPRATPAAVQQLLNLVPKVPLILVVSALDSTCWEPLRARATELLRRPVSIGEVIAAVRRTRARQRG
jgi:DNA-binding response OmpR family regulator